MKNIKEIVIAVFAVIGFATIASGFTNDQLQNVMPTVPESHVWSIHTSNGDEMYSINAVTGEVRKYAGGNIYSFDEYKVMVEKKPKEKKK